MYEYLCPDQSADERGKEIERKDANTQNIIAQVRHEADKFNKRIEILTRELLDGLRNDDRR